MMKILMFCKVFANPTLTFIYNEIEYLRENGHDVMILTMERKNELIFPHNNIIILQEYNNIERRIRHILQSNDIAYGFIDKKIYTRLQKIIFNFKPDVIHCHFGFDSWFLLLNCNPSKIPILFTLHGFDVSHKLNSARYRNTLKNVFDRNDIFPIFISNFAFQSIQNKFGQLRKSKVLFCGIDIEIFRRTNYNLSKRTFVFLQISSFAEKKGHKYTIQAFYNFLKFSKRNVKLILAGDGAERHSIVNQIKLLAIDNYVKFVGIVDRLEASSLMNDAHAFLHHSVTSSIGDKEGIPTAIMEAMAMELPIISTFHAGIPELVEDGVNGLLVNERDVDAYAEAMNKILTWDYLPQNRAKIEAYFEKEKHGKLLVQYYEDAIHEMKKQDI
ncbi:MAG: glycosyltransferase family 4 protein [Saprospiraceae bacterium]